MTGGNTLKTGIDTPTGRLIIGHRLPHPPSQALLLQGTLIRKTYGIATLGLLLKNICINSHIYFKSIVYF
jgi:hypothetical protein